MKKHVISQEQKEIQRAINLSRRHFLKGVGACMALPMFEALAPRRVFATEASVASSSTGAPVRMAFVYFPNGAIPSQWWPTGDEASYELGKTMEPLNAVKNKIQIISGLDHVNATAGPDGAGD